MMVGTVNQLTNNIKNELAKMIQDIAYKQINL